VYEADLLWASFPESVQDYDSAAGKADYGTERGDEHQARRQTQQVGECSGECKYQSEHVQPHRGMNARVHIFAKTKLQEQRCEPDRGDYDHGQWTVERLTTGIKHNDGEGE
jgi:hypothetical protein